MENKIAIVIIVLCFLIIFIPVVDAVNNHSEIPALSGVITFNDQTDHSLMINNLLKNISSLLILLGCFSLVLSFRIYNFSNVGELRSRESKEIEKGSRISLILALIFIALGFICKIISVFSI